MLSQLRHRVAVIGALALVASVAPVLSSSPAGAVPQTALTAVSASDTASYSACPTGSAPASGFSDTTSTDVDCIAMHGITKGVTATTYEPDASIPRWQMALYLTRAATSAGVTLGSGADQGFTDIAGESAEIQTAINQIKQLGVTTGTTATTFSPDDNVTREQMAMFLERLLKVTPKGPGGSADVDAATNPLGLNVNGGTATYNYDDIDGGAVSFEGHNAIVEIYHLGLTGNAKTDRTFNPGGDMTRGTMATWMANALAHTNARPAGLWIQSAASSATGFANNSPTLSVSHRDSDRLPVAGTIVDIHEWQSSTTAGEEKSLATGKCNTGVVGITGNSLTVCKVELGDMTTNASGNVAQITDAVTDGKTMNWYAWTAAAGTTFVEATHGSGDNYSTTSQSSKAAATLAVVSTDLSSKALVSNTGDVDDTKVKYGDTVNVTIQMSSAKNGSSWPAVAQSSVLCTLTDTVYQSGSTTVIESLTVNKSYTDADGKCTHSMTEADQATTDGYTRRSLEVTTASGTETSSVADNKPGNLVSAGGADTITLTFDDDASAYNSTTIAQNVTSVAAGSALAPVSRNATASNWNQYGDAFTTATALHFQGAPITAAATPTGADTNDLITIANHGLSAGDPVIFRGTLSTKMDAAYDTNTVYYVIAANIGANVFALSATSGGGAVNIPADVDDCGGSAACDLFRAPANYTASRTTTGGVGTASVSWSDTASTSSAETVTVYKDATNEATSTTYRHIAPASTTALGNGGGTAVDWTESAGAGAGHITATPVVWDDANNELILEILHGAVTQGVIQAVEYIRYSYDDNDVFYLQQGGKGTTLAGFEGAYVAGGGGLYGLKGHQADGTAGVFFTLGDMQHIDYEAIASNVSVFNLGT